MKRIILVLTAISCVSLALPAQEQAIDLAGFLSLVEENSLDLTAAETDRLLAGAQERLAKSAIYPMIGGQAGYTRNFIEITQDMGPILGEIPMNTDNEFSFGVSVEQAIFDMKAFRGLEASREYLTLTGSAYEATRQAILTAAKKLFYQTLLLQKVLEVRKSSQAIAYENFQETRAKFDSGVASRMDMLRAEVNWKVTIPETTQAAKNLDIARTNLKNMAGIEAGSEIHISGSLMEYPDLPDSLSLQEVLNSRPDYTTLLNKRQLQEINVAAKRAEFYPSLSANLSYGWQAANNEFNLSDPTESLSAGLTVNVPIFYGGSRFAQLDQARLELEQTQTSIAKKQDDVRTQIETIRLSLQEASDRIESARQTLSTAEQAYEITSTSLESGLATQLELKDSRLSLEGAQLQYYSAIFDYLDAFFDWQSAVGEGAELL
ncbi:TolC family protein [Marispirochaeta sp.]|uniref:TolC family protein n=1 Tax=Marispirochaeta sp. TaxID=2038653 RepID=UPI0029C70653|nr:TolC family protein [Marispirochaeta sp.]